MPPDDPSTEPSSGEAESIRAIVPSRAVLTELARGFLLVHETNTTRAVQFALTFLREREGRPEEPRLVRTPTVTRAQRSLGRLARGAVEPSVPGGAIWTDSD